VLKSNLQILITPLVSSNSSCKYIPTCPTDIFLWPLDGPQPDAV
jgi:hypothetical protein